MIVSARPGPSSWISRRGSSRCIGAILSAVMTKPWLVSRSRHPATVSGRAPTLIVPASEPGIRRFCLWALGMAVLTLRKLNARRDFANGQEVKISRNAVKATVVATNLLVSSDRLLELLFAGVSLGLPQRHIATPLASVAGIAGQPVR